MSLSHLFSRAWPILALLVLIVYFFQESVANLQHTWRSYEGYEHGPLVVGVWLIGLVVIKSIGHENGGRSPSKVFFGITILILALISFFNKVGATFEIEIVQYATTFAFAVVAALLVTRPESLFKYTVLAIFLASGMPFWDIVLRVLQALTIQVTDTLLSLVEVPVLFTGDVVDLPHGRFRIAEGCGGLRYFLSALAISTFYVFLYLDDRRRGILFVIVTCMLALVANWVRVAGIVWIGYLTEMQSDMIQDHYAYGWLVFSAFLIPSFWFGQKLQHANVDDN